MFKYKRVAIDFDGTLFEEHDSIEETVNSNILLEPKELASETTHFLKNHGFEILIFTCRPDYHRQYMENLLKMNNIIFDYILFYTKPRVDLYIDDKGYRFENWQSTKIWLENKLND
jgi:ribonucleotide monophosphatase NagD (HAD superfamily)